MYFDRDLNTLSKKEMLALAVLVRAPSRWDLFKDPTQVERPIRDLAKHLFLKKKISKKELDSISNSPLDLNKAKKLVDATHFVRFVRNNNKEIFFDAKIKTTINSEIQSAAKALLRERLSALKERNTSNGAVLVVDNNSGEILAWVSASNTLGESTSYYDTVLLKRQPGSTLKPFLYALALEKGWSAGTLINDSPLEPSSRCRSSRLQKLQRFILRAYTFARGPREFTQYPSDSHS